jgi:hypothetical protein
MISVTTEKFRICFSKLPKNIQLLAQKNYKIWMKDNYHPSVKFKQVHQIKPIFSARVGLAYRAIGVKQDETIIWFWIGSHSDYNNLLSQL